MYLWGRGHGDGLMTGVHRKRRIVIVITVCPLVLDSSAV